MKYIFIYLPLLFLTCTGRAQEPSAIDPEKMLDLMQNQRYKEAVAYIKSVCPESTSDDKIISRLAYCNYMAGNLPEAEKNYLLLYLKDSTSTPVLTSLANVNLKRGNYSAAAGYLKKVLLADSLNFFTYKQLGQIGQITEDTNTVKYLEKANMLNAQDPDVAFDLSTIYILRKKFGRADTVLIRAIEADSSNLQLIRNRAKLMYAKDQWTELISLCKTLIKEGDDLPSVTSWLGEAYYSTKQFKKCIEIFQKDRNEAFEKESSLYFVAKSYKNLNDQVNAIKYFRKTITSGISPNIGNYYVEIGDSQEKLRQNKAALSSYSKSLQFEENGFTYYMIAQLYDQAIKNPKMAATYFKKFIKSTMATKPPNKQYIEYAHSRIKEIDQTGR